MTPAYPARVGTVMDNLGGIAARLRDTDAEPAPPADVETPDERDARLDRQHAARRAAWLERLPSRFTQASLDTLRDQQAPHLLRDWLDREPGTDPRALNLVLVGESRLGKTYAAYALGNAHVAAGGYAVAWTLADLNAALRPDGDPTAYDRVVGAGLLLLDDVGREQVTAWSLEQVQRLLDARNRERRRTVATTNLGYDTLVERYGDPVVERLLDDAEIVKVTGEPISGGPNPW